MSRDDEARTPPAVWDQMQRGNTRFVEGKPSHPRQDVERRHELAQLQRPRAALFGCSDSRLAAEIIFDMGLGDLFVVRNAGQIVSDSALGSLEYAVAVLEVPLILVLGHDECGAVRAAIDSASGRSGPLPPHISELIRPIVGAVRTVRAAHPGADHVDAQEVGRVHLRETVGRIVQRSELISDAVAEGRLAVVGANYRLVEGRAVPDVIVGKV